MHGFIGAVIDRGHFWQGLAVGLGAGLGHLGLGRAPGREQEQPDDYIIASGEVHSVKDLVQYAFDHVGLAWQDYVQVDPTFYRPDEAVQLVGSIDKIHKQLTWKPDHSFKQLVEVMVEHDLKALTDEGK
ncbi:MAG: hypothetical protein HC774_03030 [Sphingomonadales bacterium]|nr:hypothetical protein [Sphingomonadales bacterium]